MIGNFMQGSEMPAGAMAGSYANNTSTMLQRDQPMHATISHEGAHSAASRSKKSR